MHAKQQTINLDIKQNNWEGFDSVKMQIHNANQSNSAAFLVVESRSDPKDYAYYKYVTIDALSFFRFWVLFVRCLL